MENKIGFRIWEIDNKTHIPKKIKEGNLDMLRYTPNLFHDLDLENNTYAMRIGKEGLK